MRTDVRRALASGDWATALRAVQDLGISQTDMASRTGLSQSQISRLVRGASTNPKMGTVRALCDGLGIPHRLAGLDEGQEDDTERRQLLTGTLGALSATALGARSELGDEDLLRTTTATFRRLEQRTPTRLLIGSANSHVSLLMQLAKRAGAGHQDRIFAAASEAAGLAGWLYADLMDSGQARHFYRLAVNLAQRSKQPLLTVYMQGTLGQYATNSGDAAQGLRLIRTSAVNLSKKAPRTARAWLASLEGLALGYLGDRTALNMFDLADRWSESARDDDPVWPWVFPFDTGKIAGHRAIAAARLKMPDLARVSFQRASVSHSPKQSAAVTVEHARALAAAGDYTQACALAARAYDIGRSYGSERIRHAVRDFRADLGSSLGDATAKLDDQLYASYTEDES